MQNLTRLIALTALTFALGGCARTHRIEHRQHVRTHNVEVRHDRADARYDRW